MSLGNVETQCRFPLAINNLRSVNVRTDKLYHFQFDKLIPSGVYIKPMIDLANNVLFEGIDIVYIYPGQWSFTYWDTHGEGAQWTQNTKDITVVCACNVTYVKMRISGPIGNELRPASKAATCSDTCGNPWPIPEPKGFSCSAPRVVTDYKNITTCPSVPLRTDQRFKKCFIFI